MDVNNQIHTLFQGLEGTWQSKSLSLGMEDNMGISVAKAVGRALVTYTVAPTISTKTEVSQSCI